MTTVLIADDDKEFLAILQHLFQRHGYKVLIAENGNKVIAHLNREPVDVVFLDVFMPEKDGLETLVEIRRHFPGVDVYIMSGGGAYGNYEFLEYAKKMGATGTLRKPVTVADLIKIVEELPRTRNARSES